jgi:hypothetical protein
MQHMHRVGHVVHSVHDAVTDWIEVIPTTGRDRDWPAQPAREAERQLEATRPAAS